MTLAETLYVEILKGLSPTFDVNAVEEAQAALLALDLEAVFRCRAAQRARQRDPLPQPFEAVRP